MIAVCMRVESAKPAKGSLGGWIHKLADPLPVVKVKERREVPQAEWEEMAVRFYKTGSYERIKLAEQLGVKVEALEELMVGMGFDTYRALPFSSWPERDSEGRVVGIVRRYMDGSKKTMRGSHHGLYFGRTPMMMPGPVYLPEGGSDTAALIGLGVNAIGRPSNTGGIGELARMLCGARKVIVVIGERDRKPDSLCKCGWCMQCWPGLAGALMTADRLSRALKKRVLVRMFEAVKDSREWIKQHPRALAPDFIDELDYDPVKDPCRVCGNDPPHETRGRSVLCKKCSALLEYLK